MNATTATSPFAYGGKSTYFEFFQANSKSKNISKALIVASSILTAATISAPFVIPASVVVLTGTVGLALTIASGVGIVVALCSLVALAVFARRQTKAFKPLKELHQSKPANGYELHYVKIGSVSEKMKIAKNFVTALMNKDLTAIQICLTRMPKSRLDDLCSEDPKILRSLMNDENAFFYPEINGVKLSISDLREQILRELAAAGWTISREDLKILLREALAATCLSSVSYLTRYAVEKGMDGTASIAKDLAKALNAYFGPARKTLEIEPNYSPIATRIEQWNEFASASAAVRKRIDAIDKRLNPQ